MKNKVPQRKPHKTMSGSQLLTKAFTGSHKLKPETLRKVQEILSILETKKK